MTYSKQQQGRRLLFLLLIPLLFLLPLSLTAESFFPDGDGSFFGERAKQPRIKLPSLPIFDKGAESEEKEEDEDGSEEYYSFSILAGAQGFFDFIYTHQGVFVGGNIQWSPVKHLGLGLRLGVHPFRPFISVSGAQRPETAALYDYIIFADVNDSEADLYDYYMMGFARSPFLSLQLETMYFPGDRGLKGFYAGLEGGILIDMGILTQGMHVSPYLNYNHETPIYQLNGGSTPPTEDGLLPVYRHLAYRGGAILGYKLIFSGITIDASWGYAISNNPVFSGMRVGQKAGYTFKGRKK